jgi:hypothetical protein
VGRLGDEGPADEIFETLLRHRPPSISHDTAAFHAKQRFRIPTYHCSLRVKGAVAAARVCEPPPPPPSQRGSGRTNNGKASRCSLSRTAAEPRAGEVALPRRSPSLELIELRARAPALRAALRHGPARRAERLLRPPAECAGSFTPSALACRERLIPAALQVLGEPRRKQRDDENQHAERDDRSNQHCAVDYPIGPAGNLAMLDACRTAQRERAEEQAELRQ